MSNKAHFLSIQSKWSVFLVLFPATVCGVIIHISPAQMRRRGRLRLGGLFPIQDQRYYLFIAPL